ncbi:MAG: class I SAM-dependent methyltransferase [Acidimicrobiia bacterium]
MHHWADPAQAFSEIGRVLKPGGRVLIWDLRFGALASHRHLPNPMEHTQRTSLHVAGIEPWPWPWKLKLTNRIELATGAS